MIDNEIAAKIRLKVFISAIGAILNISAIFLLIFIGQSYPAVMFFSLFLAYNAILVISIRVVMMIFFMFLLIG